MYERHTIHNLFPYPQIVEYAFHEVLLSNFKTKREKRSTCKVVWQSTLSQQFLRYIPARNNVCNISTPYNLSQLS